MNRMTTFTLLAVDDNPHNLFALRSLIERHFSPDQATNGGITVKLLEAQSGRQAIDIALQGGPLDLIVLDIQMPEMDGFETAELLKTRRKTRDIPIIFLTAAFKTDEFQQRGYAIGAADYLLKPIDDNLLVNKLGTYFRLIEKERSLNQRLEQQVEERTAELASAKQHIETILNTMGEALLVLDPQGRIVETNPACRQLLGYPNEALIGTPIGDIFEEDQDEQAGAFMGAWLEALIRSGALKDIDARFIHADGRRIPVLFSRTAVHKPDGALDNIICVDKDMSGYAKISND